MTRSQRRCRNIELFSFLSDRLHMIAPRALAGKRYGKGRRLFSGSTDSRTQALRTWRGPLAGTNQVRILNSETRDAAGTLCHQGPMATRVRLIAHTMHLRISVYAIAA